MKFPEHRILLLTERVTFLFLFGAVLIGTQFQQAYYEVAILWSWLQPLERCFHARRQTLPIRQLTLDLLFAFLSVIVWLVDVGDGWQLMLMGLDVVSRLLLWKRLKD